MARTTVILDDNVLLDIKHLAQARRTTATHIIHEALTAYVERESGSKLPAFAASGRSGKRSVARNSEALLQKGLGNRRRL